MAEYEIIPKATIDAIEESIQRKRGTTDPIHPSQMPLAIDTIPSSVDGTDVPVGGIYLTKPDNNGNPTEALIVGLNSAEALSFPTILRNNFFPYLEKIAFIGENNITSFVSNALQGNENVTTLILPKGLASIADGVLWYMSHLSTLFLPNSIVNIGSFAFNGCVSLKDVTIEQGFNCAIDLSTSTLYTAETIVSWLEALADRTGQATFTLTIGTTNLNKLTAEQKAIATNKNWTLA